LYTYPQDFYMDPEAECSDADNKSKKDPLEDTTGNYPLVDFELLARRRPQEDLLQGESLGGLGDREVDRQYNWSAYVGRYKVSLDIWE
jgi:hypothetical protein